MQLSTVHRSSYIIDEPVLDGELLVVKKSSFTTTIACYY